MIGLECRDIYSLENLKWNKLELVITVQTRRSKYWLKPQIVSSIVSRMNDKWTLHFLRLEIWLEDLNSLLTVSFDNVCCWSRRSLYLCVARAEDHCTCVLLEPKIIVVVCCWESSRRSLYLQVIEENSLEVGWERELCYIQIGYRSCGTRLRPCAGREPQSKSSREKEISPKSRI